MSNINFFTHRARPERIHDNLIFPKWLLMISAYPGLPALGTENYWSVPATLFPTAATVSSAPGPGAWDSGVGVPVNLVEAIVRIANYITTMDGKLAGAAGYAPILGSIA